MALRTQSQREVPGVDQRSDPQAQAGAQPEIKSLLLSLRERRWNRDSAEFIAEARHQTQMIAQSPEEAEDLEFIESISMNRPSD